MRKLKVCLFPTDWNQSEERRKAKGWGGVTYYRLWKFMEYSKKLFDIDFYASELSDMAKNKTPDEFYGDFVKNYDVVVTKIVDNMSAAMSLVKACKNNKTRLIVDIDDNLFAVRPDQPGYQVYYPGSQKRAVAATYLSFADSIITSTKPLADFLSHFFTKEMGLDEIPSIYTVPNANDVKDWQFPLAEKDPTKIVIGWAGSITHNADLEIVLPHIDNLMSKYPHLHFEVVGGVTPEAHRELLKKFKNHKRLSIRGGTHSWQGYPELLCSFAWDIGVIPTQDDVFNESKSHIKWMEYAMAKIPSVASNIYPYREKIQGLDTIVEGVTGFLAKDDEWTEKLELLIKDKDLRKKIGENAYNYIAEKWQYKDITKDWQEIVGATKLKKQ